MSARRDVKPGDTTEVPVNICGNAAGKVHYQHLSKQSLDFRSTQDNNVIKRNISLCDTMTDQHASRVNHNQAYTSITLQVAHRSRKLVEQKSLK